MANGVGGQVGARLLHANFVNKHRRSIQIKKPVKRDDVTANRRNTDGGIGIRTKNRTEK